MTKQEAIEILQNEWDNADEGAEGMREPIGIALAALRAPTQTGMSQDQLAALSSVLDYETADEEKHWEEQDRPAAHVYHDLKVLAAYEKARMAELNLVSLAGDTHDLNNF